MTRLPLPRSAALAVTLLVLVGCKPWQPIEARRILSEDASPIERACLEEARNAPSVRVFDRQVSTGANNFWPQERVDRERRIAENRAFADCLRRNGIRDAGGVEPILTR